MVSGSTTRGFGCRRSSVSQLCYIVLGVLVLLYECSITCTLCQLPWTIVSDKEKHDCDQVVTQKFVMKRFVCHNDNNIFSIIIVVG